MTLVRIFTIDKNVIKVINNKDVKFFGQNVIDITLKACRSIQSPKKHYMIFGIAISGIKSCFSFVAFLDPHLIIGTGEI